MKLNKKPLMFAAAVMGAAASSLAFAPHASAAAITVVNPSFETAPGLPGDVGTNTGWTGGNYTADASAPDGSYVGYVYGHNAAKVTAVAPVLSIAANTTYTLSVYVEGYDNEPGFLSFFNGGISQLSLVSGTGASAVIGATGAFTSTDVYSLETLSFDSASNPSLVGTALNISLGNSGTGLENFDNVQLSSTADAVPEPSTIALMLGGIGAHALVRRMRRTA